MNVTRAFIIETLERSIEHPNEIAVTVFDKESIVNNPTIFEYINRLRRYSGNDDTSFTNLLIGALCLFLKFKESAREHGIVITNSNYIVIFAISYYVTSCIYDSNNNKTMSFSSRLAGFRCPTFKLYVAAFMIILEHKCIINNQSYLDMIASRNHFAI